MSPRMDEPGARSARELTVVGEGFSFLEGPRWHDGRLWASDFFTRRVLAFGDDGVETVCELPDSMPSGLGWDREGRLLISSMLDRRIVRLDDDGRLAEVADLSGLAGWHVNDMVVDDLGGAYVGNFGWNDEDPAVRSTQLLRVEPNGEVSVAAEDVVFPNGIAISPDGGTLLLAETFAGRISAFDRAPDGTLSRRRTWADFHPGGFTTTTDACASGVPLPDGMALDAEGALWIGDAHGTGAVRIAEGGEVLEVVSVGAGQTAFAVALGGPDRRTLYLCAALPYRVGDPAKRHVARLLSCRVDVPGVGRP